MKQKPPLSLQTLPSGSSSIMPGLSCTMPGSPRMQDKNPTYRSMPALYTRKLATALPALCIILCTLCQAAFYLIRLSGFCYTFYILFFLCIIYMYYYIYFLYNIASISKWSLEFMRYDICRTLTGAKAGTLKRASKCYGVHDRNSKICYLSAPPRLYFLLVLYIYNWWL